MLTRPLTRLLRALEGVVLSYRDGDFSLSIASRGSDELGRLVALHNALGAALREQRQHLLERELLLDTLVQNTPVALLLSDDGGRVAYANIAARRLLGNGRSLDRIHTRLWGDAKHCEDVRVFDSVVGLPIAHRGVRNYAGLVAPFGVWDFREI